MNEDHTLWTIQDIADHMKRSANTVQKRYITLPGFPVPINKLGGKEKSRNINPLYYRSEVLNWIHQQRREVA